MKKKYDKPVLSIDEQIELLKLRKLIIWDIWYAKKYLNLIGYYRLSMYCKFFQISSITENGQEIIINKFQSQTTFEDIVLLYNFDRGLRLLVTNIIEKIENSFKSYLISNMVLKEKSFFQYLEDKNLYKIPRNEELKRVKIMNEKIYHFYKSKPHKIIENFKGKYLEDYFPFHMFVNLSTFWGIISYFYLLNNDLKWEMARQFWYSDTEVFLKHLNMIKEIRNIVSHHDLFFSESKKYLPILFHFKNQLFPSSHIEEDIVKHYVNKWDFGKLKDFFPEIIEKNEKYSYFKLQKKFYKITRKIFRIYN